MTNEKLITQLAAAYTKALVHNPKATIFENMSAAVAELPIVAGVGMLDVNARLIAAAHATRTQLELLMIEVEAMINSEVGASFKFKARAEMVRAFLAKTSAA